MGASFGAVAALSTAWRHPDCFGRLLLQSGLVRLHRHRRATRAARSSIRWSSSSTRSATSPSPVAERVFVSCGIYESLIYENRSLVPLLQRTGMDVRYVEARDGHNWENWRDRLREGLSWLFPGPLVDGLRVEASWPDRTSGRNSPWPNVTRRIGLSLGADICWPICLRGDPRAARPARSPSDGDTVRFEVERVTIEPFDLRQPCALRPRHRPADALVPHEPRVDQEGGRSWTTSTSSTTRGRVQSMEKHTTYCAMMRLGLADPGDLAGAAEGVRALAGPAAARSSATRGSSTSASSASELGYPMFMKPYDGGGWVGVSRIDDAAALRAAYEQSGKHVMHLQKAVDPLRPASCAASASGRRRASSATTRRAPLHDRYTMDRDFLVRGRGVAAARHDADDQRVLRLGLQLVRVAARRGRRLAPDRLRQPLPRLAGDVAALPLPVAGQGEPPLVDLLRGARAPHAAEPRLGARSTRSPDSDRPTGRSSRATPDLAHARSRPTASRSSARRTSRISTRSPGSSSAPTRRRRRCARRSRRCIPPGEVDQFTELFFERIERWRDGGAAATRTGPARSRSPRQGDALVKATSTWHSHRRAADVTLVRWGHVRAAGAPLPDRGR